MQFFFFFGLWILLIGIAFTWIKRRDIFKSVRTVLFVFSLRVGGIAIIAIASFMYMGQNLGIVFGLLAIFNLWIGMVYYNRAKAYEDNHPL